MLSCILILDSLKLSEGPVAVIELPFRLSNGIHGSWIPAANLPSDKDLCDMSGVNDRFTTNLGASPSTPPFLKLGLHPWSASMCSVFQMSNQRGGHICVYMNHLRISKSSEKRWSYCRSHSMRWVSSLALCAHLHSDSRKDLEDSTSTRSRFYSISFSRL